MFHIVVHLRTPTPGERKGYTNQADICVPLPLGKGRGTQTKPIFVYHYKLRRYLCTLTPGERDGYTNQAGICVPHTSGEGEGYTNQPDICVPLPMGKGRGSPEFDEWMRRVWRSVEKGVGEMWIMMKIGRGSLTLEELGGARRILCMIFMCRLTP